MSGVDSSSLTVGIQSGWPVANLANLAPANRTLDTMRIVQLRLKPEATQATHNYAKSTNTYETLLQVSWTESIQKDSTGQT